MNRRQFLQTCGLTAAVAPLAGCVGGPGDEVTMLAVNEDDVSHAITVWVVRGERLRVAETVDVAAGDFERVADLSPDGGSGDTYRVTVQLDGDPALVREFVPETWFNQLDVFVSSEGAVELRRAKAG